MTPEQEAHVIEAVTRIDTKMELLITNGGSKGLVPEMRRDVDKHDKQINFWRGAIAVVSFLLLAFGTVLFGHMLGGH